MSGPRYKPTFLLRCIALALALATATLAFDLASGIGAIWAVVAIVVVWFVGVEAGALSYLWIHAIRAFARSADPVPPRALFTDSWQQAQERKRAEQVDHERNTRDNSTLR